MNNRETSWVLVVLYFKWFTSFRRVDWSWRISLDDRWFRSYRWGKRSKLERGNEVCMEISSDLSCDSRENLCREDDAERDGQKETGVEKEGKGWMETKIESDSQTKGRRDFRLPRPSVEARTRDLWECENCVCSQYYCFCVCFFGKLCPP